jgi:M6 family metalloprotease-like protein
MPKIYKMMINLLFVIMISNNVHAAWLDNIQSSLTQPDKTVIDVLLSGDEFHNWAHNEDGYTIIQDIKTGNWCWAKTTNEGGLESTGYPIHLYSPQSLGLQPKLNISEEKYQEKRRDHDSNTRLTYSRTPTTGTVQNITFFIKFLNEPNFLNPVSVYESMLNASGNGVISMHQYFMDVSYCQLFVHSPIFQAQNGYIVTYEDNHQRSYYQPYSSDNLEGYNDDSPNSADNKRTRELNLVYNAVVAVRNLIPPNLIIDSNNDGYVDNINFIIKGETDVWNSLLWSHKSWYNMNDLTINGKQLWDYTFNFEQILANSNISVLVHEFGHSLSLPDLYRYNSQGIQPVYIWDVMGNREDPPQSISAFMKYKYTGWVENIQLITASGSYSLSPITLSRYNHAYRINTPYSTTEYFIIEYRKKDTGFIDSILPASGLIIYRVNTVADTLFEYGNYNGPPDELYVYRPNGTLTANGNVNMAFFSANSGRTEVNDTTNPSSFLSNGGRSGLKIFNIGPIGDTISFNVKIEPNNLFVYPSKSIQAVINNVAPGRTIKLLSGIYDVDEEIIIDKDITIIGSNTSSNPSVIKGKFTIRNTQNIVKLSNITIIPPDDVIFSFRSISISNSASVYLNNLKFYLDLSIAGGAITVGYLPNFSGSVEISNSYFYCKSAVIFNADNSVMTSLAINNCEFVNSAPTTRIDAIFFSGHKNYSKRLKIYSK